MNDERLPLRLPFPVEIIGLKRDTLTIRWDDDHVSAWSARDLRLQCRCAECIDEVTGKKVLDANKVPWPLHCEHIEMVGNYGVRFAWSDGHHTGIFRLRDLRASCPCRQCRAS
ncbi:MAG: DUF971 domain-containing protein [Myxococcota bacterium]